MKEDGPKFSHDARINDDVTGAGPKLSHEATITDDVTKTGPMPTNYVYSFTAWPDETWRFSSAVFELFKVLTGASKCSSPLTASSASARNYRTTA